jgi:hypothetical protein
MYPEVHTLASATPPWSGVEAKAPQTPRRPQRILLEPFHQKDVLHPLWNLEGGNLTFIRLGQSPQLNWRFPRNRHADLTLEEYPRLNLDLLSLFSLKSE